MTEQNTPPPETFPWDEIGDPAPTAPNLAEPKVEAPTAEPVQWVGMEGIEAALDNLADLGPRQEITRAATDTLVNAIRVRADERAKNRPEKVRDESDLRREIVGAARDHDVCADLARVFERGAKEALGVTGDLLPELPQHRGKDRASAKVGDGDGFDLKVTRSKRTETSVNADEVDDVLAAWLISEHGGPSGEPAVEYARGIRDAIAMLRELLPATPGYKSTALDLMLRSIQNANEDELAKRLSKAYGRVEKGEPTVKLDRTPIKTDDDQVKA